MHLVYINPNATVAMTDSVVETAKTALPNARVTGLTNTNGPVAIEGPEDGQAAIPGVLDLVQQAQSLGADAIVIACFDDTGLAQARDIATCPVLGIGQSAYMIALLAGGQFSVVTSLPVSVPVIEENIASFGFAQSCASVRASGLAVLAIEEGSEQTLEQLAQAILQAKQQDSCQTVILGCAGMAALRGNLTARTGVTLVDGVVASAHLAVASVSVLSA